MNQQLPTEDRMYQASLERDTRFEGVFVMAVKTTGIFCRPSCHARKPHRQNVEFFATPREALAHGYRPCRVCRPLEPAGATPDWILRILREVEEDPSAVPGDGDLRANGVDSAYQHGFESLSGFTDGFRRTVGISPSQSTRTTDAIITVARILTPLGPMLAGATDQGLCLLEFTDRRMLERQITLLEGRLGARAVPGSHPILTHAQEQIRGYFGGHRQSFDLPLDLRGTPFQMEVWRELLTIPYGTTRSYAQQATRINRPTAVRAVGRANGENRLSIVVPCHRVVGSDGTLTGYGGGLWRKKKLLELEQHRRSGGLYAGDLYTGGPHTG